MGNLDAVALLRADGKEHSCVDAISCAWLQGQKILSHF